MAAWNARDSSAPSFSRSSAPAPAPRADPGSQVEQPLFLAVSDEHVVAFRLDVRVMRVPGLGQPLADGLDALVPLVGDVGHLGRGGFQMADSPLGVAVGGLQVVLGRGVVADQDALDEFVLGRLDLDDRRG